MIIGGYNDTNGNIVTPNAALYLDGNVAEIIAYSNQYDMTDETRQLIEGYLANKWGIQSYLPVDHPYTNNGFVKINLNSNVVGMPSITSVTYASNVITVTYYMPPGNLQSCEYTINNGVSFVSVGTTNPFTIAYNPSTPSNYYIYNIQLRTTGNTAQSATFYVGFILNIHSALNQYYPYNSTFAGKEKYNYSQYFRNGSIVNNISGGDNGTIVSTASNYIIGNASLLVPLSISSTGPLNYLGYNNVSISSNDFTLCFWAKSTSETTNGQRILTVNVADGTNSGYIVFATYSLNYQINGGIYPSFSSIVTAYDNTWKHIAIIISSTTFSVYVNAAPVSSATFTNLNMPANLNIQAGGYSTSATGNTSYVDDVRFYTTALTTAELTAIYNFR
jgi:hypothetical protein